MNRRAGIDTFDPDYHLFAKVNLPFDDRDRAIEVLQALQRVSLEKLAPTRHFGHLRDPDGTVIDERLVVRDLALNLLVGFGLRFFAGPLDLRGSSEEPIPNFPPGGTYAPRAPSRFAIVYPIPLYLRTMNATGDRDWLAKRLHASAGQDPSEAELDRAYRDWLAAGESDLLLCFEAENLFLVLDFWDAVRSQVVETFGLELVALQQGFQRGDGRDHTGYQDGISNLQDKMRTDPQYYRSKVYLPHPAPAYPGEPDWARDDPRYDGGTYLVHRKYIEHLDRWATNEFSADSHEGETFHGEEARDRAIGRDRESGRVLSRFTSQQLDHEPDDTEVNLGFNESHILKARGGQTAPFSAPFPPLSGTETNVFNTQDIRIRRRGVNFCELDTETGALTYGLYFICFQNNIQQTGFEFINNIWLLNPLFRRSPDSLFDPESGVIEPVQGCYYFVPPEHRHYPGEVFFV